jgi:NAD(P)-dependent dehydrogenase (short-subunit alcohol dehydrogenase family)
MKKQREREKPVALITGGTRGIGFGIAQCLSEDGYDLAVNGMRKEEEVVEALDKLRKTGSEVIYCQGSVADPADRSRIMSRVRKEFGKLNVLINNAGIGPRERKDILEATEESFDHVIRTNLKGPYFLTQLAASWMIDQQLEGNGFSACIIFISSVSSTLASINRGEYCISKAGISMATALFALRLGEFNIPVYEVRPGIIETDMTAGVKTKYDPLIQGGLVVQRRWGYPRDVGKAVSALTRGDLPFSTGQVLMVDGGLTIQRL